MAAGTLHRVPDQLERNAELYQGKGHQSCRTGQGEVKIALARSKIGSISRVYASWNGKVDLSANHYKRSPEVRLLVFGHQLQLGLLESLLFVLQFDPIVVKIGHQHLRCGIVDFP